MDDDVLDLDALNHLCRAYSDPLFFHDFFLASGHSEKTVNATATFIEFRGHHYLCTCRHVKKNLENEAVVGKVTYPTLALMVGRTIVNLSFFPSEKMESSLREVDTVGYDFDICVADIENVWSLLERDKQKKAINLDNWHEPIWSEIKGCAAAGYPTDLKSMKDAKVEQAMLFITANVASELNAGKREFSLWGALDKPCGYYFSGISGGPIMGITKNGAYYPIGIVFEGTPSSKQTQDSRVYTLAGPNDILIRGLVLTPERFEEWLLCRK